MRSLCRKNNIDYNFIVPGKSFVASEHFVLGWPMCEIIFVKQYSLQIFCYQTASHTSKCFLLDWRTFENHYLWIILCENLCSKNIFSQNLFSPERIFYRNSFLKKYPIFFSYFFSQAVSKHCQTHFIDPANMWGSASQDKYLFRIFCLQIGFVWNTLSGNQYSFPFFFFHKTPSNISRNISLDWPTFENPQSRINISSSLVFAVQICVRILIMKQICFDNLMSPGSVQTYPDMHYCGIQDFVLCGNI